MTTSASIDKSSGGNRPHRVFLLSPANAAGERARLISAGRGQFELARRLRQGRAVPLGEIFSFLSGLYFRGKAAYGQKFARAPENSAGVMVITTNRGLLPAEQPITLDEFRAFGTVPIDATDPRYREPLERGARRLRDGVGGGGDVVLLGSIATGKYVDVLLEIFGDRLLFPAEFVGRGDMSRGGLMLRAAASGQELEYIPVTGAIRHGSRPPKLMKRR